MDLDELERLAKAATPGEWRVISDHPVLAIGAAHSHYRVVQTANQNNVKRYGRSEPWHGIPSEANAAYIAAANPTTILSLITRLRDAEAALKPFADAAEAYEPEEGDDKYPAWAHDFPIGALRQARRALEGDGR